VVGYFACKMIIKKVYKGLNCLFSSFRKLTKQK